MKTTTYTARIFFETVQDSYKDGEDTKTVNSWTDTVDANSLEKLLNQVADLIGVRPDDISRDDINEYPDANEYWASKQVNKDNDEPRFGEIVSWKKGKTVLYSMNCQILVSKLTKEKATL